MKKTVYDLPKYLKEKGRHGVGLFLSVSPFIAVCCSIILDRLFVRDLPSFFSWEYWSVFGLKGTILSLAGLLTGFFLADHIEKQKYRRKK